MLCQKIHDLFNVLLLFLCNTQIFLIRLYGRNTHSDKHQEHSCHNTGNKILTKTEQMNRQIIHNKCHNKYNSDSTNQNKRDRT